MKLIIQIPCYNEAETLEIALNDLSSGLVTAMEKYAAEPTFGEETSMTISFNASSMLTAGNDNSELSTLAATIFAIP